MRSKRTITVYAALALLLFVFVPLARAADPVGQVLVNYADVLKANPMPAGEKVQGILFVLAPDHLAATTKDDPDLYWYISVAPQFPLEFSLSEDQAEKPLLEKRISPPLKAGLNRISLKDAHIKLSKGVQYRWFVAMVPDEVRRSKDLVAGAMIERVDPSDSLKEKLSASNEGKRWAVYAQEGVWYDAIMTLSDAIAARPDDRELSAQRDNLLTQVGLSKIGELR